MSEKPLGRVLSLHLHPEKPGGAMRPVETIELVEQKGIVGNGRYFGRISRVGTPSKRQVSLIEREQIIDHAGAFGLGRIPPGTVRSNIETSDVDLIALLGKEVQVGETVLLFYEARTPCEKMDRICEGLRARMEDNRQGVLAQVVRGGRIQIGDAISVK